MVLKDTICEDLEASDDEDMIPKPSDEVDDLLELPASLQLVQSIEGDIYSISSSSEDELDDELVTPSQRRVYTNNGLPPRKRQKPLRYRD